MDLFPILIHPSSNTERILTTQVSICSIVVIHGLSHLVIPLGPVHCTKRVQFVLQWDGIQIGIVLASRSFCSLCWRWLASRCFHASCWSDQSCKSDKRYIYIYVCVCVCACVCCVCMECKYHFHSCQFLDIQIDCDCDISHALHTFNL